jgi:hypothetical protein
MKDRSLIVIGLAFLMLGIVLPFGYDASSPPETRASVTSADVNTIWERSIALQVTGEGDSKAMDGVAIGDADPTHYGQEIISVCRNGNTYMASWNNVTASFESEAIWNSQGQQLTAVVGDLKPGNGNEVLVVGLATGKEGDVSAGNGTATLLSRSGTAWTPALIYQEKALIHGADIGDVDPTIPGNEAIVTSFTFNTTMVWWDAQEGAWNSSFIYQDSNNVRKVVIADLLPERPGNEFVAVSKSGNVTLAYGNHTNWTVKTIHNSIPLARVAVGDIDANGQLEIYLGSDKITKEGAPYAEIFGLKRDGDDWEKEVIYTERDSFRGVWVGDVDPNIPGSELYTFGYTGNLTRQTGSFGTGWTSQVLFKDVARGHEIKIGDTIPTSPGLEIAAVGYSGILSVVHPSRWEQNIAFRNTAAMDGVAVGEADPTHNGQEVITVDRNGAVNLVGFDEGTGSFEAEEIYKGGGQLLTPVVGDLKSGTAGNEILVVGVATGTEESNPGDGTATVLSRSGSTWTSELAYTEDKLIHGADIGDLDPTIPGNEAVVTTFSFNATMIWYDQASSTWKSSHIFTDSHNVRKVYIADLLPERPGNEMVAVSKSGNVTLAYGNHTNWTVKTIHNSIPLARVALGDMNADGQLEIYLGSDKITKEGGAVEAEVFGLKRDGDNWEKQPIYTERDSFRGVWVGDVDPDIDGTELYSFGYTGNMTQHAGSFETGWESKVLFRDTARGHEIRIGEVIPGAGPEIVLVGYSQTLNVISLKEGGEIRATTIEGPDAVTVNSGSTASVDIEISGEGLMYVAFSAPAGITSTSSAWTIMHAGKARVTVEAGPTNVNSTVVLTVTVNGMAGPKNHNITVTIVGDTVRPAVTDVKYGTAVLTPGGEVPSDGTLVVTMTKTVTKASFDAAVTADEVAVMRGSAKVSAAFTLGADMKTMTIVLADTSGGDATLKIGGLTDMAGNEMGDYTFDFKTKVEEVPIPTKTVTLGPIIFEGNPAAGATVEITHGSEKKTGTTGSDGKVTFTVPETWINGTVQIKVTKAGYKTLSTDGTIGSNQLITTTGELKLVEESPGDEDKDDYTVIIAIAIVVVILLVLGIVLFVMFGRKSSDAGEE